MGLQDWNWKLPAELQDVPWDCACASVTWAMNACDYAITETEVVASMYPQYVNEYYGLLDASGAGLVEWLATMGISAENNPNATWDDIVAAAGHQPLIMGGRAWNHWTGVRIPNSFDPEYPPEFLALANPSPGWQGIYQIMMEVDYNRLGPWSALWFTNW